MPAKTAAHFMNMFGLLNRILTLSPERAEVRDTVHSGSVLFIDVRDLIVDAHSIHGRY